MKQSWYRHKRTYYIASSLKETKDKINYIYVVDNKKHILVNLSTPDEFNNEENFGGTHNTIFNSTDLSFVCARINMAVA